MKGYNYSSRSYLMVCDLLNRDLKEEVQKRIPPDTPVPCDMTIMYAFAPPNSFTKSSQRYTGRVNLKHAVQRRQLRAYHVDSHYCNAIRKYIKEFAVENKPSTLKLSYVSSFLLS